MDLVERFLLKVEIREDGCWDWTAGKTGGGYGAWYVNGKQVPAHRWSYEQFRGPIPDGLDLDHTCHNRDASCPGGPKCRHRRCVNPDHTEPATRKKNLLNSLVGSAGRRAAQTRCIHGHEFTPENTKIAKNGTRHCRACDRRIQRAMKRDRKDYNREYQRRRRAAARQGR